MDDQIPSASTPIYRTRTKNRQRSSKPYERPAQSFREKIVDSVSSIVPDWLKSAASFLTNTEPEEETVTQEQSVLSPGSSRSSLYQELPSEIRDASIRPSLSVLREEQEGSDEPRESNSECNENHTKNLTQHVRHNVHGGGETDDGQRAASESTAPCHTVPQDPASRLSLSMGTMNRLEIPEDNLKRLKINLSKRSRLSMPCSSSSPPAKASRHETVDSDSSRLARNNSDVFKMSNASFSSSFTYGPRSPFYDGKTSFGGSSSRRMSRLAFPYSMAGRKIAPVLKVRASEMAKSDLGKSETLSCASQKILDVINKESSLLEDTKKIPINDSGLSNRTVFNNFVTSSSRRVSSTRTRLSMPSHITTSLLNKSITSTHQSDTNNLDWRLNPNTFADDTNTTRETHKQQQQQQQQPTTLVQDSSILDKVGGKMKSSLSKSCLSNRSSRVTAEETETTPVVDLPQISLPLKNLPTFNSEFKKSDPLTKDVNQFKFSWPLTYSDSTRDLPKVNSTAKAFTFSTPSNESSEIKEHQQQLIYLPSSISTNVTSKTPSESPAISDASWSCPKCIFRNDHQHIKCLVCETLKPDTYGKSKGSAPVASTINKNINSDKVDSSALFSSASASASSASSWGDKFKKPPGTWTCDVCMVDNKAEHNKCVACETEKPGCKATANSSISTDSANLIVPNTISKKWTCDTCYVTNEENRDTCISCEMSRKTGDTGNTKANYSGYKFNLPDKSPPPFKFGCTDPPPSTTSNISSVPSAEKTVFFGTNANTATKLAVSTRNGSLASTGFPFTVPAAGSIGATTTATTTTTTASVPTAISAATGLAAGAGAGAETSTPATKTLTFNPTSNTGSLFTFGAAVSSNTNTVPPVGIATTNGSNITSIGAENTTSIGGQLGAKSTQFNFTPSAPLNISFTNSAPKFTGSTSNGSLASTGFRFTAAAAGSVGATSAALATTTASTVTGVTTAGGETVPATKTLTFNPPSNPVTPFTFGAAVSSNTNTVPPFGIATTNGSTSTSIGADNTTSTGGQVGAKPTQFNFNPSSPINISFANSAPKFTGSTSNGSLGTPNFIFTGGSMDPLRGENTSGRVVRKAKRRLNPTSK